MYPYNLNNSAKSYKHFIEELSDIKTIEILDIIIHHISLILNELQEAKFSNEQIKTSTDKIYISCAMIQRALIERSPKKLTGGKEELVREAATLLNKAIYKTSLERLCADLKPTNEDELKINYSKIERATSYLNEYIRRVDLGRERQKNG